MVKNTGGGNKSKKQGRKHIDLALQQHLCIRYAKEGELYAVVTKIFGGSNCQVMCQDGILRSCIIRSKFRWVGKKDNLIILGGWILVGVREWEVRTGSAQKCDLLEVYSHNEKEKIRQTETCDLRNIINVGEASGTENEFLFSSNIDEKEMDSDDNKNSDNPIIKQKTLAETMSSLLDEERNKKNIISEQLDWMDNVNDI
jgi:initiation factor 1A